MIKRSLAVCALVILSTSAVADMFRPSHSCVKPLKPFEFSSQFEVDHFNREVDYYRSCIDDFVDEQNRAAENHMKAAEDAIYEWNSFVDLELN